MNRKILLLCISFCLPVCCFSQCETDDECKLQEVLNKLLDGLDFQKTTLPIIKFKGSENRTATYGSNIIRVERKAYNTLKNSNLLDEGLALVIGHELGHLSLDPNSKHAPFSVVPFDMNNYKSQQFDDEDKKMEDFCDYFGCFAAHRAGYDIWNKTAPVLQTLCKAYGCKKSTSHHTNLDRVKILDNLQKTVEDMSHIFDVAYKMTLIGEYQKSQACYEIIEKRFPSREIINNKALNQLLEGLTLVPEPMNRFSYPFELDNETRLREGVRAKDKEEAKKSKQLISTAIQTLKPVVSKHPEYTPAIFNLACAYLLADDLENAEMHFNACIFNTDIVLQHKAKMGKAIIEYISYKDTSELEWLEMNATTKHLRDMAKLNLRHKERSNTKKSSGPKNKKFDKYSHQKSVGSRKLFDSNIRYIESETTPIYSFDKMILQINDTQVCAKGYSKNQIEDYLNTPPYSSIPTKSGTYYLYKNKTIFRNNSETIGLVVLIDDQSKKVVEYFMFYVE